MEIAVLNNWSGGKALTTAKELRNKHQRKLKLRENKL